MNKKKNLLTMKDNFEIYSNVCAIFFFIRLGMLTNENKNFFFEKILEKIYECLGTRTISNKHIKFDTIETNTEVY